MVYFLLIFGYLSAVIFLAVEVSYAKYKKKKFKSSSTLSQQREAERIIII